ncbi:MAG: hypothetical protein F6K54_17715 [Okeania sp. SIO3B5]|nr:hypothetical protein [Okeania sp. SIO3B5]NEO54755.1 hypothetical protein [Okeania sp. SIO3B5]
MKCLVIFNPEKILKSFGMLDFLPADVAELFRAKNLKYLNFLILTIQ